VAVEEVHHLLALAAVVLVEVLELEEITLRLQMLIL
jgi:hypothetical protein